MGWITSGDRRIDSQALDRRALQAATALERLGVGEGDGVALYLRNDIAFFEAAFAAGALGAYPTPVNWHYTPDEAAYVLRDCAAKVLVIHADLLHPIRAAVPEGMTVLVVETPSELRAAYGVPEEAGRAAPGALVWDALVSAAEPRTAPSRPAPSTIIYTSGTTGRPKGVKRPATDAEITAARMRMLTFSYGFAEYLDPAGGRSPDEIVTAVIGPVYHSAPNAHSSVALRVGANVVIVPRFDPEELLKLIEDQRITHLNMVPIMFNRLLKLPEEVRKKYDLSSLKFVAHAAAPVSPPVKRAMIAWWGPVIYEYYGSTEMGNVSFCSSEEWLAHPGSVGRRMPEAELRVIDEEGRDCPPGEVGEVVGASAGARLFTYQNDDAKRRGMEREGLITPGDVGYFDADGFLYLCDRKNDMIISGGVNIYPAEIEAELHKLPEVADCAVFGIPDEEFGEQVYAVVQPQPGTTLTEADVKAALRASVAGYKMPRRVEFAAELPREDSGKIFKRKLRAPFWEGRATSI